jgi:hypothetical protein
VPHKFDEVKQVDFIEYYKTLKEALGDDETLLFMDAVHPTQVTKITAGWIRTGSDKAIKTTGIRTRINIVGEQSDWGTFKMQLLKNIKNSKWWINHLFFKKVRPFYPNSDVINLILNGADYRCSGEVKEAARTLNIKLYYLLPYSPNLNPIEWLWKVMNEQARNKEYFATTKEFW